MAIRPDVFLTITCRKPSEHLLECIESVRVQTHPAWRAHVTVDDVNTADDGILRQLGKLEAAEPRLSVETRTERWYALKNQLDAIDRHCPHDAIVGKLDGDDKLLGEDTLKIISREYTDDPELDILWTKFKSNSRTPCCCGPLPDGANPLLHGWKTSHFQTFRKRLLWAVRREVFIDPRHGSEWRCSCDHALYLPLLLHSRKRKFLNRVCYFYRRGSGENKTNEQKSTAHRIRQRNLEESKRSMSDSGTNRVIPRNVLFVVNGPTADRDKRFFSGERRPPLGVLSMAAHLRARRHNVLLVDRFMNPKWFPEPKTLEWADMAGFYISTPNAADARDSMRRIRELGYKGPIAAGGPHAILWPDQVKRWGADIVYPGEADFDISRIVETRQAPEGPRRIEKLDQIPFPAYDLLQEQGILGKYSSGWPFTQSQRNVMTLNTSRGCPYNCAFCDVSAIWGRKWHAMSPERVSLDVKELVKQYGAQAIYFREDNFCVDPRRVERICQLLPEGLHWACEMRADLGSDESFVRMAAEAGCQGFYVGAESGSDRMLQLMSKDITAEQIVQTCANAQKHGIYVALSMIKGYPGETDEDRKLTKQMLKRVRARHVWRGKYRKPFGQYEASPIGD